MHYQPDGRAFERMKAFIDHHDLSRAETAKTFYTPLGTFKHWLTGNHQTPGVLVALLEVLEQVPEARRYLGIREPRTPEGKR